MEVLFSVEVRGDVVPKQSAKFRQLPGGQTIAYQPAKVKRYTDDLRQRFSSAVRGREVIDQPLSMELIFWLPRPVSRPKKCVWPDRQPDVDNLTKPILDALESSKVISNDSRICTVYVQKRYCQNGWIPGFRLVLYGGLDEPPADHLFKCDEPDLEF